MTPTEQSPLLNGNPQARRSLYQSTLTFVKAEGEPSWLDSYRWFVFGSWLNLLLLLVPVATAAHYLDWDAPLRFGFSFIAIVPLAKVRTQDAVQVVSRLRGLCPQLLGDATEQMSLSLGQTLAGLLNASFGNAVEIIVGITALLQGEVRIVQTSVSTRPFLRATYTYHVRTDAWLYSIESSPGFGLFLPCWYVVQGSMGTCTSFTDHI